jgi:alpha-1,3-rhamnosyltransferase
LNVDSSTLSYQDEKQIPLVSILVPSYNHEQYILECLESIRNLDYPRLELLVSDDCSQDDTFPLAEEWAYKHADRFERTLVVRQDKNLGIVGNLQYLFDNAQGLYLAYIASDDMFVESAITNRVDTLQKTPGIDAIFGDSQDISESGDVVRQRCISKQTRYLLLKLSSRKLLAASLVLNWPGPGPVMMIRKNAVTDSGSLGRFPVGLKAEDQYLYLRLAALGKLAYTDCVVARYRRSPSSLAQELFRSNKLIQLAVHSYRLNRPMMKGFNRIALDNRLSRYLLQLNTHDSAFDYFRSSVLRMITGQLKFILSLMCLFMREPRPRH